MSWANWRATTPGCCARSPTTPRYLQKLAGRLSHELKTPLAITRSSLDNLASREHDPEALRYLDRAREGVERQAAIIRAMSEASRLEAAVQSADWEAVDLAALLRACAEAYRALYPGPRAWACNCRRAQCAAAAYPTFWCRRWTSWWTTPSA